MKKIITLILTIIAFAVYFQSLNAEIKTEFTSKASIISKGTNCTDKGVKPCEIIQKHAFSRQDREDTFKLIYKCENLEDSMVFQIIDFSGDIIYERRFRGTSFYDDGRPWYIYVTDPKRGKDFDVQKLNCQVADSLHKADIQYIQKRMNEFFNDDRFVENPIMKLNKKHLNKFQYDGISGDSTAVGFKIQLYEEGFEMIAYSKKMQKVQFIASAD